MQKKNVIMVSSICLAAGIISAVSAYIFTREKGAEDFVIEENKQIYKPVVTEEPSAEAELVYEPIYYSVQTNGSNLNLYEMRGDNKKVVKTFNVNLQMFPEEDVELLKNGIKAMTLEDGLEIMENFTS